MNVIVRLFFSFLLVWIAWLQLNDPDPYFWATLYFLCACIPVLPIFTPSYKYLAICASVATIICLGAIYETYPGMLDYMQLHINDESLVNDMSPDKPYIEEGRELIGTLIALFIVLSFWYLSFKEKKNINRKDFRRSNDN